MIYKLKKLWKITPFHFKLYLLFTPLILSVGIIVLIINNLLMYITGIGIFICLMLIVGYEKKYPTNPVGDKQTIIINYNG